MTVCYFGSYKPDYPRNRIVRKGLALNGVRVVACHSRLPGLRKWRALWRQSHQVRCDLLLVGFPGHAVMPLAWLVGRWLKVPVVFDAFTSQYEAVVVARRQARPFSLRAAYHFLLDWISCRLACLVLMDTAANADYLAKLVRLPRDKFAVVYVGSDIADFPAAVVPAKPVGKFAVHFHGHYSPFQGADVIVRAAKLLEADPVSLTLIGRGQEYPRVAALAQQLGVANVEFVADVDYPRLRGYLERADLALGVFGSPERPVIPNKVFEAMALGKPVLTARLLAMDELFAPNVHVAYCQPNDPADLAAQICRLRDDPDSRQRIAAAGHRLYQERLTPASIGKDLASIIQRVMSNMKIPSSDDQGVIG